MTDQPDYRAIGERIEANQADPLVDGVAVMTLLGCETRIQDGLLECRLPSGGEWRPAPRFDSADDFEIWVLETRDGQLNDMGRNQDGSYYAGYEDDQNGNDYGDSKRMGAAMWAAFVHLVGKVDRE